MVKILYVIMTSIILLNGCKEKDDVIPVLNESFSSQSVSAVVSRGDIYDLATYDGKVYPVTQDLSLGIDGPVGEIFAYLGQEVKKGDVLLTLDDKSKKEELIRLEAELEDAKINNQYINRQTDLDIGILKLSKKQAIDNEEPAIEIAQIEANIDKLELLHKQALNMQEFNLSKIEKRIKDTKKEQEMGKITAPFDGSIVYIGNIKLNDYIRAYDTLFIIADHSKTHIQSAYISESEIRDASHIYATIKGKEYNIDYQPLTKDEGVRMRSGMVVESKFKIDGNRDFLVGDYACIYIKDQLKEDVIFIPKDALYSDSSGNFVYKMMGDSLERTNVDIGSVTNIHVEILNGLEEGDEVLPGQSAKGVDGGKGQKTVKLETSDYIEKAAIKNAELTYLRNDNLAIKDDRGNLSEYLVQHGQRVAKGEPLLSYKVPFDSIAVEEQNLALKQEKDSYQAQLKQKQVAIVESKKMLQMMEQGMDRESAKLRTKKMEIEYDQYKYQGRKRINQLEDYIEQLESNEELKYIYAPYDGIINIYDRIKEGTQLNPYMGLLHINDIKSAVMAAPVTGTSKMWYGLEVSIAKISDKQVSTENFNKGKILSHDSVLDHKASTGMIYIGLEDQDIALEKANIISDCVYLEDVLVIPMDAVHLNNSERYVYVLDEDGEVHKQIIAGRDNAVDMWVYSGLIEGQSIILESQ